MNNKIFSAVADNWTLGRLGLYLETQDNIVKLKESIEYCERLKDFNRLKTLKRNLQFEENLLEVLKNNL